MSNQKNVIVVMLDTLRRDHVGCYGNKWIKTPNLDAFAKESMVFDRCVAEALPTLQVRRAMFTGMRVFPFTKEFFPSKQDAIQAGATFLAIPLGALPGWAPIPWDLATLPEMIRGVGAVSGPTSQRELLEGTGGTGAAYRTALITDCSPYFGPSMNYNRGFSHWDFIRGQCGDHYGSPVLAKKWDIDRFIPPWLKGSWEERELLGHLAVTAKWKCEEDFFAPQVFRAAIEYLEDNREADDSFFLCVDAWDPHEPWDPPQHYVDLYDPGYKGIEMIHPHYGYTDQMTEKELKHMRALYAGEVTMVDTWFGKFMDKVRGLGLLDGTLIIVTSDHGHMLGEHGFAGKLIPYWELIDSVLMIRHPEGVGEGQRSGSLVQHHDICATVLNFLGVKHPYELDGKDLMPILDGKKGKVRDYATCGFLLHVWCDDGEYILIDHNTGANPQLFDMGNDPEQRENLASDKPKIVKRLFDLILADADGGPILPHWDEIVRELAYRVL